MIKRIYLYHHSIHREGEKLAFTYALDKANIRYNSTNHQLEILEGGGDFYVLGKKKPQHSDTSKYHRKLLTANHGDHDASCACKYMDNCDKANNIYPEQQEVDQDIEYIDFNGKVYRVRNAKLHCEYGPAIVNIAGYEQGGAYFLRGKKLTLDKWLPRVKGNEHWAKIMSELLGDRH